MTGYKSKRAAARDKLDDDDTQVYKDHDDTLTIAYQSGYYDGKTAAAQEPDTYRSVPHGHCTHPRCKEVFSAYIEVNKRLAHYEPEGKSPMILNAATPQRPWVGLTDEDIADYLGNEYHDMSESELRFFRLGEAATKEKNSA